MKKQINELLAAKYGRLKLNSFATLERYTEDALGNPCDVLRLEFKAAYYYVSPVDIKARNWQDVVEESGQAMAQYFTKMAERASDELRVGHGIGEVTHEETFREWAERKAKEMAV